MLVTFSGFSDSAVAARDLEARLKSVGVSSLPEEAIRLLQIVAIGWKDDAGRQAARLKMFDAIKKLPTTPPMMRVQAVQWANAATDTPSLRGPGEAGVSISTASGTTTIRSPDIVQAVATAAQASLTAAGALSVPAEQFVQHVVAAAPTPALVAQSNPSPTVLAPMVLAPTVQSITSSQAPPFMPPPAPLPPLPQPPGPQLPPLVIQTEPQEGFSQTTITVPSGLMLDGSGLKGGVDFGKRLIRETISPPDDEPKVLLGMTANQLGVVGVGGLALYFLMRKR